ncbi:MAG: DUF4252 domain-containing protein [Planctomycetota bacterium]
MAIAPLIACRRAACAALLFVPTAAYAETPGSVDFAAMDLPPATVEIDAGEELVATVLTIGESAVAGVAETLLGAADEGPGSGEIKTAAEKLNAVRSLMKLAGNTVHEVHVRVYEGAPNGLAEKCQAALAAGAWQHAVSVREGDESARVSVVRRDNAIVGVFVMATEGDDAVLVNVVGDLSPENVKKLTAAATKIGLDHGLREKIIRQMHSMDGHQRQHAASE